jgi:pimeloyl-ACP methyl ester carboxylesterase
MTAVPGRLRRLAVRLAQHAACVLPGARSSWADAMRRELDYIGDDPAALRWALGCILASYRARLVHRPNPGLLRASAAWRHVAASGVAMLVIGLVLQDNAGGQTVPPRPAFEETICDLPGVSLELRPRLRCGTVSVPRDYGKPDGGRFKLAVIVIKSEQQPAWPEPVVYINGGPGNPITVYAAPQARTPYASRRDLILVDQRGTGRSEPSLCPDLGSKLLDANLAVAAGVSEEALAVRQATYLACRDEAVGRGLDLNNFGTRVTAEDFEQVRQALRIERWNVYGESYGTTVAMTLTALHPDAVRSAVLDAIYPPDPVALWSTTVNNVRDAFFAHCARDNGCATSFPDLAGMYRDTLEKLAQSPLVVAVPPHMRQRDNRVSLTASLFEVVVTNLLYYPNAYPAVPRMIQSVHDGVTQGLGTVLASQLAAAAIQNRATHAARSGRHQRADPGNGRPIRPGGGASLEPSRCGTDRQERAPGRLSPGRSQREAIQSLRSKDRGGFHRPPSAGTRHIVCRSGGAHPLPAKVPDTLISTVVDHASNHYGRVTVGCAGASGRRSYSGADGMRAR